MILWIKFKLNVFAFQNNISFFKKQNQVFEHIQAFDLSQHFVKSEGINSEKDLKS